MPISRTLYPLVAAVGVIGVSLSFFHPAFWALFGAALGLALLMLVEQAAARRERPALFGAFLWVAMTSAIAFAYGATQSLYNLKQILLVLAGLTFGYFMSLRSVRPIVAWAPYCAFAAYFAALMAIGQDPNEVFARNSQNYVSVILLALFASAMIMTRPPSVRLAHVSAAMLTLLLSVWAAGRGGILASLLLTGGLTLRLATQDRSGLVRILTTLSVLAVAVVAVYFAATYLNESGYLYKFEGRGLRDPSRLTILSSYFENISAGELLLGRNYYDDSVIGRWGFNLHNSYLDAWAHLGVLYLLFVLAALALVFRRRRDLAPLAIAIVAFAVRAATDSQLLSGQFDYVFLAAFFLALRVGGRLENRRVVSAPLARAGAAA